MSELDRLPPAIGLRAILITLVGVPTCAAVVSGTITTVALSFVYDVPLDASESFGGAVGSFFAAIVLAIAVRAVRRAMRGQGPTGGTRYLALAAFSLVPVGLVVGVAFVATAAGPSFADRRIDSELRCRRALGDLDDDALDACVPIAYACRDAPVVARGTTAPTEPPDLACVRAASPR
jgi:hypothetical protein